MNKLIILFFILLTNLINAEQYLVILKQDNIQAESRFNENGFDSDGIHKDTGTAYDSNGYDQYGYDQNGFNSSGTHIDTGTLYNPSGYDKDGYDINGLGVLECIHDNRNYILYHIVEDNTHLTGNHNHVYINGSHVRELYWNSGYTFQHVINGETYIISKGSQVTYSNPSYTGTFNLCMQKTK